MGPPWPEKDQALVEVADGDQAAAQAQEGERPVEAGEGRHVEEEDLDHHQRQERRPAWRSATLWRSAGQAPEGRRRRAARPGNRRTTPPSWWAEVETRLPWKAWRTSRERSRKTSSRMAPPPRCAPARLSPWRWASQAKSAIRGSRRQVGEAQEVEERQCADGGAGDQRIAEGDRAEGQMERPQAPRIFQPAASTGTLVAAVDQQQAGGEAEPGQHQGRLLGQVIAAGGQRRRR